MNSLITFLCAFVNIKRTHLATIFTVFALSLSLVIPTAVMAGDDNGDPGEQVSERNTEWQLLESRYGVDIYYKHADCNDAQNGLNFEFLQFKFVNATASEKQLSWNYELYYADRCVSCGDTQEHASSLTLAPNQVYSSDCENYNFDKIGVFSRALDADTEKLTQFKLANLNIY